MAVEEMVVEGVVRNGVIVPDGEVALPEGMRVRIVMSGLPPELQTEFDAWDRLSNEAWAMIDQWEKDEGP